MQLYPMNPQSLLTTDSPTFAGLTLTGLTPNRLISTDSSDALVSVSNLASWIAGTTNQISVANDGDGTITLSTPQDIATASGVQFGYLGIGVATDTTHLVNISKTISVTNVSGYGLFVDLIDSFKGISASQAPFSYGGAFTSRFTPHNLTGHTTYTVGGVYGCYAGVDVISEAGETYNITYPVVYGFFTDSSCQVGSGASGTLNLVTRYGYYCGGVSGINGGTITNNYSFYDDAQTGATNNWGFYGLTANHFLAALQIGGTPTVGMAAGSLKVTGTTTLATSLTGILKASSGVVSSDAFGAATQIPFVSATPADGFDYSASLTYNGTTLTVPQLTDSGIATTQVVWSNSGLLSGDANLTYVTPNLIGTGYARFDGGLGINTNPSAGNIIHNYTPTAISSVAYYLTANSVWSGPSTTNPTHRGINFAASWTPAQTDVGNRTLTLLEGGYALLTFSTASINNARTYTVTTANGYNSGLTITKGTVGAQSMTTFNHYKAGIVTNTSGVTVTNLYAFYDSGQTAQGAGSAWGFYGLSAAHYLAGTLQTQSRRLGVVTATTTYTQLSTDDVIYCNSTTAFAVTLLAAATANIGKRVTVKNINTGAVTVTAAGSDTIDGSATQVLGQWDSITMIQNTATTWIII